MHDVSLLSTAVNCGTLANPANGSVSYSGGTTYGHTATYSCSTGYNQVGSSTRRCYSTGRWSGSEPTCQGMLLLYLSFANKFHVPPFNSCGLWDSDQPSKWQCYSQWWNNIPTYSHLQL